MKISAIITTHNRLSLLKEAVASVLAQTQLPREVVIVDDASTDGSKEWCEQLDLSIPYRYIRNEKPCGGAVARNYGIAAASGEFVAFLDDDDRWLPEKLERQAAVALCGADLIYTASHVVNEQRIVLKSIFHPIPRWPKLAIAVDNFIGITSTVMVRRELLLREPFDTQMPMLQDYDLFIRCVLNGATVNAVSKPLVEYLFTGAGNSVSQSSQKFIVASKRILQKYGKGFQWLLFLLGLLHIFMHKCFATRGFFKSYVHHIVKRHK